MPLIHTAKDYLSKIFLVFSYMLVFQIFLNYSLNEKKPYKKRSNELQHNLRNSSTNDIKQGPEEVKSSKAENKTPKKMEFMLIGFIIVSLILDLVVVLNPLIDLNELLAPSLMSNDTLIKIAELKKRFMFLPLMLFSVVNSLAFNGVLIKYFLNK
jgi:hypothetical protein